MTKAREYIEVFSKGAATAIIAHLSAWLAAISVERAVYIAGHVVSLLALRLMNWLHD